MFSSYPSVMVIDDELDLAKLYSEYLQIHGVDSVYFTDPNLALKEFKNNPHKYSTIIADYRMPEMSGLELASKIRKLTSDVKIFLLTAYELKDKENSSEYKQAKIERILQKPIRMKELQQQVIPLISQ